MVSEVFLTATRTQHGFYVELQDGTYRAGNEVSEAELIRMKEVIETALQSKPWVDPSTIKKSRAECEAEREERQRILDKTKGDYLFISLEDRCKAHFGNQQRHLRRLLAMEGLTMDELQRHDIARASLLVRKAIFDRQYNQLRDTAGKHSIDLGLSVMRVISRWSIEIGSLVRDLDGQIELRNLGSWQYDPDKHVELITQAEEAATMYADYSKNQYDERLEALNQYQCKIIGKSGCKFSFPVGY